MKKGLLILSVLMLNIGFILAQENKENTPAPKIVKTIPALGNIKADPSIKEIILEFDQDMGEGYSLVDCPDMPEMQGKPKWLDKRRFSIPVKLYSNKQYQIAINSEKYLNFKNEAGIPMKPSFFKFHTKKTHDKEDISPLPKIINTIPAYGEKQVDPSITEIILEFDQDMTEGYSIVNCPNMPKISGKPIWLTKRKLSIPVELSANKKYQLTFNNECFFNFKNEARIPMKQSLLKFRTKK